jgi:hypothetical protein
MGFPPSQERRAISSGGNEASPERTVVPAEAGTDFFELRPAHARCALRRSAFSYFIFSSRSRTKRPENYRFGSRFIGADAVSLLHLAHGLVSRSLRARVDNLVAPVWPPPIT